MYSAYSSSVLWSIRNKGFYDYSYLFPERYEKYTLALSSSSAISCCASSRSCCCCRCSESSSSFIEHKVSINPRFVLHGLRQSTLIQWPPFRRRLLVGGRDRVFERFLGCEVDEDCCEVACRSISTRRNRGFRFRVSGESDECHDLDVLDDAEAMITLLSEEYSCSKGRNRSSGRRVEERKRVRNGDECYGSNVRRVEIEEKTNYRNRSSSWKNKIEEGNRRERFDREENRGNGGTGKANLQKNYDSERSGGRKRSSGLENDLWAVCKSDSLESRRETSRKNEEREARLRRTKSSSCSSYYSLSSSGEFENDIEDHYQDENQEKSDNKRVVEVSNNEPESSKEASQMDSRRRTDNSKLDVALEQRRRKQHSQRGGRVSESKRNHKETEIHEVHVSNMEVNSQNQKRFSSREDNTVISVGSDVDRENMQSSSQHLNERLGIEYTGKERVSQRQRHSKYSNIQEADIKVARNSVQKIKEQQRQREESMFRRAELRGTTELFSEKSGIHDSDIKSTYVSHTENQERSRAGYTGLVSGSRSEVKEQHQYTDRAPLEKIQSGENSMPVSHSSGVIKVRESQRTSEKRIIGQESTSTSIVQLTGEEKESPARKDSRVEQTNSRKEDQKAYGLHSSREKVFEEASSTQSSLTSRNRIQQVTLDREEIRDSQTVLVPPPSQLVKRGSGCSYRTGGCLIQDLSYETSEAGDGMAYEHPAAGPSISSLSPEELLSLTTHEDVMGSARRSDQSSMHLIGEFVEMAQHEASISETRKEEKTENNQLTRRDSRQSSRGSGAKGPADEMWVTGPDQETSQAGVPEGTAAGGHAIMKRGGRSLWGIIADIARLRWGSRAETPDSAAKLAVKGSPNESSSSVTWFSGREHNGSSDDNAKGDKRISPQEAASPHQPEHGQISSRSQFESSSSVNLTQQLEEHEVEISSSGRVEGGPTSRRVSSVSGDQGVGLEEERSFQIRLPETDAVEVPLLLPARSLRRSPAIKEPSESSPTGVSDDQNVGLPKERKSFQSSLPKTDAVQTPLLQPGRSLRRSSPVKEPLDSRPTLVSGISSLKEQVEQQPPGARSNEETVTLTSDSVLKQRKLQRNKQVTRDTFDEWEEAYRLEAERRKVDEMFMREAILEAKKAADMWEVPVGAVLVHEGKIIARGCNLVEELRDSTAHAEMICIREGSKVLHSWRLADTTLYVTLEPCPMCAGAILQARVNTLVWGAPNKLLGADGSWIRLFPGEGNGSESSEKSPAPVHPFHPKMTVRRGILESECAETMQQFFQLRRKKKNKAPDNELDQLPPTPPSCLPVPHHHPSKLLNKMHQFFHFMFCL